MEIEENFGTRLKKLRQEMRFSQEEMAEKLDVCLNTYRNYEQNKTSPPYDTLCKMRSIFGVTTDYLLTGKDDNELTRVDLRLVDLSQEEKRKLIKILQILVDMVS